MENGQATSSAKMNGYTQHKKKTPSLLDVRWEKDNKKDNSLSVSGWKRKINEPGSIFGSCELKV